MALTKRGTTAVLLAVLGLWAATGPAQPLRGANQDTAADKAGSKPGDAAKPDPAKPDKDKKNPPEKKGTATVTITVLNDKDGPVKNAVVELLYAEGSKDHKTTGADGKVSFQTRKGSATLRITADRMEIYQDTVQVSGDQKELRVVLKKST
jgi:hypothetical protein